MVFFRLAKFLTVLFFLLLPNLLLAAPPVASGLFMTVPVGGGGMKIGHNIVINFTYTDPDGNAQQNTLIEWLQYDSDCPGIATIISSATVSGATVTSNFNLPASTLGKHISCRVTPRDNTGTLGTPVEFRPWSCGVPNPVLTNSATCVRAGGGVVGKGNSLPTSVSQCSGLAIANWTVDFTGINYVVPGGLTPKIIIDWGDGITETLIPFLVDNTETNFGKQTWRVLRAHTFDYSIPGRTASTTVGARCTYTLRATYGVGATNCSASVQQTQPFTVWDTEDNVQLGTFDVDHDPTSAGVQTAPPAPLPASTENTNICEDDVRAIRLFDNTDFNCTPPLEDPIPLVRPGLVNDKPRWVQWVYGTAGSNITTGPGASEKIIINGVSYTAAQLPVFGRPFYIQESTVGPSGVFTDDIVMPTSGLANEQLFVTLRSWNTCNAFDRTTLDGCGLNPPQIAPFNVFDIYGVTNQPGKTDACQPSVGSPFFANAAPKLRNYTITIIDSPSPPTVPDKDICSGDPRVLNVTPTIGGLTYNWYLTNADALANTNVVQANNASFTPTNAQSPVGSVKSYFVTASAASGCVSPPEEVVLTRRNDITAAPPAIIGDIDVCPNGTELYSLPVNPVTELFGGTTEYIWTVPVGWTLNSGQGTKDISVTTNGTTGARTLSVIRRYVNATTSGSRCDSNPSQLVITVRANPTATPVTPVNICEGTVTIIDGNPSNPFGTITSHSWTGNTAILNATNIQAPNTLAGAASGTFNLTYTVTNSIGCSGSTNVVVNISANPALATTGADQLLCQALLTSNPLGGSNPGVGIGTWTLITKPAGSSATNAGFSNQATPNATFTGDLNGQYLLRWTVVNGSCNSSDDIIVDFGTDPGPQNAGAANGFCSTSGSLNAVAPPIGIGTWTQVAGPIANNTTFANPNSNTSGISLITSTAAAFGNYTYRWTVVSGTCVPQPADVVITFSRPPTASPQANFTSCVDQTILSPIAITGTVGGGSGASQQGRWEIVSGSGTFTSNSANPGLPITGLNINDQYTPSAADFAAGFVDLRLVAIDPDGAGVTGPCGNINSTTLRITIDKKPTQANAGSDQPTCNSSLVLSATPINNGGTGTWTTAVAGVTFNNINSPTATVSNLPIGPTVIRWTAASSLGIAGCSSFEDITITRSTLPNAIDPAPNNICETTAGSGNAIGINLTDYNDGVTGIAGSFDRSIEWFSALPRNLANQITTPASVNISNGQVLFTRVTNTITTCSQDGQVTFTVNSLPIAVASSFSYCEDFPSGSGQVTNIIDLTTVAVKNTITGNAPANRTITWFSTQIGAINNDPLLEINPANALSITSNTAVFARVRNDLTGCVNIAQVDLLIAPRPADPIISGSDNQCIGNFDLYNITPVGGATYIWSIDNNPLTQFKELSGGGVNDFLVVLEFPNVYTGDVKVKVNLNGCETNEVTKTITVDAAPPAVSITPGKDPVCENDVNILYTATALPNTNYSWVLPGATGTIITQTGNQVSVNIGTTPGLISVTPQTQGGNCAGSPATLFVDIKARPSMAAIAPPPVCSDNAINVNLAVDALSVPASGFNITNVFVSPGLTPSSRPSAINQPANAIANDIFNNRTGGNLLVQYTIVPLSVNGCEGTARDILVTIKPEPILDANLGRQICSGELIAVNLKVATGSFAADQFEIFSINNPAGLASITGNPTLGVFGPSVIADDSWRNTTGGPAVIEYFIRPINSTTSCVGDPPIPVTFTIDPEPVVTLQTDVICSGTQPTITLTSDIPGSSFTWTVKNITGLLSGATNGTGTTITNVLVNAGLTPATVTYEVRAKAPIAVTPLLCEGLPQDIVITVNPAPIATSYSETVCSDASGGNTTIRNLVLLEPGINNVGGVSITWFEDAALTIPIIAPQLNAYSLTSNIPVFAKVDNGQCNKVASVTYTVNPLPAVIGSSPAFSGFEITCNGSANGQINAVANSGTAPYVFSINGGATYVPIGTFTLLVPNNYIVRVKDSKGCEANSPVIPITEPTPVLASAGPLTNINCKGSSTGIINIVASGGVGGYVYSLNGGAFQPSFTFSNLTAGTYTIAVRDLNGCTDTDQVILTEPTILSGSITTQTNIDCSGGNNGAVTVLGSGGSGGYTYSLGGAPSQVSGTFTGLIAGNYAVTVFDSNLCSTPVLVNITQPLQLSASLNAKTDVGCNGGTDGSFTVVATGGTSPYQFDIGSGFQISGTFNLLAANTYLVNVRDARNCTTSISVTVVQPPALSGSITSQTNVLCQGQANGSVTVNGLGGSGTFQYSIDGVTFGASGTFGGLAFGNYVITVRDQNLCTATVNVSITEPTLLTGGVVSLTDALCNGSANGTVGISGSGGTPPYQYSINGGGLFLHSGIFSNLAAGNFTVIVRDNNLCTTSVNFTIDQPLALSSSVISQTNVDCKTNATGNVTVSGSGGTAPYNYSIDGGTFQASGFFNSLLAGTHTVRVQDNNLCTFDKIVIITEPAFLVVSELSKTNIDCNGNSTGSISVTASGGTTPYQFSIAPSGNPPGAFAGATTFNSLTVGTYTAFIRDAKNCQSQTDIILTQPTPLVLSLVSKVDILCFGQSTGSITLQSSGGTSPYEYSLNGGPFTTSNTFAFLAAGNYTMTTKDFNGCQQDIPVEINQPSALTGTVAATSSFAGGFNVSCFNGNNGQVTVTVPPGSGSPNYTFLLLQDPGNNTGQTTGIFNTVRGGNYSVRITDSNGCSFITNTTPVTQPNDISITISKVSPYNGFDISCLGENDGQINVITTTGGAGGFQYVLDQDPINTTGQFNGVFTGLASGLYSISVTDANTCSKTSLPQVLVDPLPLFEGIIGLDKSVCAGSDPTAFTELAPAFGGVGNYVYQWQQSTDNVTYANTIGAIGATFDPPVLPVTTFYKRKITSGSCTTLESNVVKVTVNPLPTATLTAPDPVCEGDFFILDFNFTGTAPFFFDYNDGTTFVNNRLGANNTPIPIINFSNTATYSLTRVRDFNGCLATTLPSPLLVNVSRINSNFVITSPAAQCSGGLFSFQWTVDADVEYTWLWNDGSQDIIPANSRPLGINTISHLYSTANSSSNTNIPVILSGTNTVVGCGPKTSSQTVTLFPNIFVNVFPDKTTICSGETVRFTNNTTGGTNHHWYYREKGTTTPIFDERSFAVASTQNFVFSNTTIQNPIVYEMVYEVNNANCAADAAFDITVYREVIASFDNVTPPPFVGGNSAVEFSNTSTPIDANDFEYEWEFGLGASPLVLNAPSPPLVVNYSTVGVKQVKLTASNPDALAAGLTTGCASVFTKTIDILLPPLIADFRYTPQGACFPRDIVITENLATGDTYQWKLFSISSGSPLLISNDVLPTFKVSNPGTYFIELKTTSSLTGQSAFKDNQATPIEIFDTPFAAFEARPKTLFVPDEELILTNRSTGANQYDWNFGDGETSMFAEPNDPPHRYLLAGKYTITLIAGFNHGAKDFDGDGVIDGELICYDTARQEITAKEGGLTRIPNAFTPNTNGPNGGVSGGGTFNDVFIPITKGVEEFEMTIFDRWGSLIFQSKDKNVGWDGYDKNGVLLPAGVYVYKLTLRLSNDQRTTQVGDVTLIR